MVIGDFDIKNIAVLPAEADPPLVIDGDGVLAETVPLEGVQAVARRHLEIVDGSGQVDIFQSAHGSGKNKQDALANSCFYVFARSGATKQSGFVSACYEYRDCFALLAMTEFANPSNKIVTPKEDETVIVKNYPNSFRGTSLLEILKKEKIDNLVICGAMSHMCIDATTRAAFDLGFNCIVAEDACATKDLIFKNQTIKASVVHASFMAALSVPYAKVISTAEFIENRAQQALGP